MKRLALLRHADAASAGPGGHDEDRPLSAAGRRQAAARARSLAEAGFQAELVLCSPARRTRETLDHLAEHLGAPPTRFVEALYLASPGELLGALQELDAETSVSQGPVLVLGHNPGLSTLAVGLAGNIDAGTQARARRGLAPATLAELECPVERWRDLAPGCGHLRQILDVEER